MGILEGSTVLKDEIRPVPAKELEQRLASFRKAMEEHHPGWKMAVLHHKVSLYYFTGTMQDGIFVIRPEDAVFWVRRSYERACNESHFSDIRPIKSFREAAAYYPVIPKEIYVETKKTTLDWQQLFHKYFSFEQLCSADDVMMEIRAVKSEYEISMMENSGAIHETVLDVIAPSMILPGVSEAQLAINIYAEMVRRGSQGTARFNMASGEEAVGLASFGKSGLVRTAFDGPGGTGGTCIAVQSIGSAFRKLRPNSLVYLDIPCGFDGYHTDKTVVYYFGDIDQDPNKERIINAHNQCLEVEQEVLSLMKPGVPVEELYCKTMENFANPYGEAFMNGGKFLGHSIGLVIDEAPAIAKGFKQILKEGMTFALEPKVALPGIGMVGTENTYVITKEGPKSLTGDSYELRVL